MADAAAPQTTRDGTDDPPRAALGHRERFGGVRETPVLRCEREDGP